MISHPSPGYFNLELRITSGGINYWAEEINLIVTGVNDKYKEPTEYYLLQELPKPI